MIACAANYSSACDCCCQFQQPLGSVVYNLHTEHRPFGSGVPRVCMLATSILYISTSESRLYLLNTALLPPLLAVHVWLVFGTYSCLWWCLFSYTVSLLCIWTSSEVYPPWKVSILVFTTVAIFSIKSGDLNIQCWVYFCWLCLLWMACIYIDYGRKFCHTLLVVFCKWDTSFTKLILKNGLSTTALSEFWMLQTSKTLMSNRYVSKVQLGNFLLCAWISLIPNQVLPRSFHRQIS